MFEEIMFILVRFSAIEWMIIITGLLAIAFALVVVYAAILDYRADRAADEARRIYAEQRGNSPKSRSRS